MSGRVAGLGDRELVVFTFDGQEVNAWQGDTIAMALWAQDQLSVRNSSSVSQPRGVLCNMGICYDCLVVVDGVTLRSCTTLVKPGMKVGRGGKP
tara:strand:+ start:46539 stop:46820 length:282 start_codon:yes stop_codon:yes gene_type:complete